MRAAVALVALAALVFAGGAGYGKGGKPKAVVAGGSSIVLDQAAPALGDDVTFTTTVQPLTGQAYPMIDLECYQGGAIVFSQLDHPDADFLLGGGGSVWKDVTGGAADCVAKLMSYDGTGNAWVVVDLGGETDFQAGG